MARSKRLHLTVLLDKLIDPVPVVSDLVRKQLLHHTEMEAIRTAIEDQVKGKVGCQSLYSNWLSYSGIDFQKTVCLSSIISEGKLQRALFDLTLGSRVKSFKLGFCLEVQEIRESILGFLADFSYLLDTRLTQGKSFWWDETCPERNPPMRYISPLLEQDPDFVKVFELWIQDSERQQSWLDDFLGTTPFVVSRSLASPVVSEEKAVETVRFAAVSSQNARNLVASRLTPRIPGSGQFS